MGNHHTLLCLQHREGPKADQSSFHQQSSCCAAQLSHVELLHLLFNLTTLWSIGDFEAGDGFAAKGGVAYYVRMSVTLLLLSGVVRTSALFCSLCQGPVSEPQIVGKGTDSALLYGAADTSC